VENENNEKKMESVFSTKIRAGKRRTYFFDVRATRGNDYFLTITESRKRFDNNGYDRHKIFLYKEDFNKFIKSMTEAIDYVKTELMPDFDFDAFNHEYSDVEGEGGEVSPSTNNDAPIISMTQDAAVPTPIPAQIAEDEVVVTPVINPTATEEVDKW